MNKTFHSNGKLLLTAEYLVLDGALAFALPCKFGQSLSIEIIKKQLPSIIWKSTDCDGNIWFEHEFLIQDVIDFNANSKSEELIHRLYNVLQSAHLLNPNILQSKQSYSINTNLTFPKQWGLGTSSTLVNNISQWFEINPFELLSKTFGGSGYDVACAMHNNPITYQLVAGIPIVEKATFNPRYTENIYFVYLNQKMNSRSAIASYRKKEVLQSDIDYMSHLTKKIMASTTITVFQELLENHEKFMSGILQEKTIKEQFFNDFEGSIKSLGAWGGDFVMVVSEQNPSSYFIKKGYSTILTYEEMIK